MGVKWTEEQQKVIQLRNRNILVSAAAGSGKTAVLVERIITMLTEDDPPVDVDKLLIVTFTEAAASEMKERIRLAIEKKLTEYPEDEHLKQQATLIHNAQITTIHSFCLSVIRDHFHAIDIDPGFRIGEEGELKLLRHDVLEEMLEEKYQEGNKRFLDFAAAYSTGRDDKKIEDLILKIYEFSRSYPDSEEWLDSCVKVYGIPDVKTLEESSFMKKVMTDIRKNLDDARELLAHAEKIALSPDGPAVYEATLDKDMQVIEDLSGIPSYEKMAEAFANVKWARIAANKDKTVSEEKIEQVKKIRELVKGIVKNISGQYFYESPQELVEDLKLCAPAMEELGDLVRLFAEKFEEQKRAQNMIDFSDMEQYALRILTEKTEAGLGPSKIAEEYQKQFQEIMIDEYQDSNLIQEAILTSVSTCRSGRYNIFMVGDVKQSIYRFRQAMPELFNEKYQRYPAEEGRKERKIVLSKNFRSRKNILDGVNFIFRQIMQKEFGDIAYDDAAALYAGMTFPDCAEPHGGENEILLIATAEAEDSELSEELKELDRRQVEATAIAARIRALMESSYQVVDKKTGAYRPLRYGDIAILLRSMKNWSSVLDDVFGKAGMPYYAETAEGYFEVPEVETMLHLLRLLDNPRQDIPLLSILHSPIYDFSADALMQIRLQGGKGLYYDCLWRYLQEGEDAALRARISAFLADLTHWRNEVRNFSLHELLRLLYRETGYYDYLSVTAGGTLRQANLRLLLEKAEQYEKGSHRGLFYFIRYVEDMKTAEAETSSAKLPTEGEDRMQVMTIHKSKGLEFPVVFVADMGKSFNELDIRSAVLLHQKWGCGMDYTDIEKRVSYRTLAKRALAEAIREENLAEELRVLYVALTRAKEKLILTGTVKDFEKAFLKWGSTADCDTEILPASRLRRAKSYLDWVMPAYLRHPARERLAAEWEDGLPKQCVFSAEESAWRLSCMTKDEALQETAQEQKTAEEQRDFFAAWESPAEMTEERQAVFRILSWQYPHGKETRLPAKLSISEIKRKYQEEMTGKIITPAHQEIRLPDFAEKRKLSSAEMGTAMHTFMEEADFRKKYTKEEIDSLTAELVQRGRLTEEEGKYLRRRELLQFFESELAERLRGAERIEKERPFSVLMQPKELFFGEEYREVTDEILVNGIIDCYFTEKNVGILIDYKSDRIYDEEELKARYRIQLELYRTALERAMGISIRETYLYSFAMGKAIPLT